MVRAQYRVCSVMPTCQQAASYTLLHHSQCERDLS